VQKWKIWEKGRKRADGIGWPIHDLASAPIQIKLRMCSIDELISKFIMSIPNTGFQLPSQTAKFPNARMPD